MALEDLAMMRGHHWASTVLYPSDAVSAERLVEAAARTPGIVYIRTTPAQDARCSTRNDEAFPVGGSQDAALQRQGRGHHGGRGRHACPRR